MKMPTFLESLVIASCLTAAMLAITLIGAILLPVVLAVAVGVGIFHVCRDYWQRWSYQRSYRQWLKGR